MSISYDLYAKLRDERGMKDFAVAKASGVPPASLSDWKTGKSTPKADKLQKIANTLEVPVEYLMTGEMPGSISEDDVVRSDQERKLLLSFRGAGKLTDEEYEEWQSVFEATLDVYLKARGKKRQ